MYELVYQLGGREIIYPVEKDEVVIGRSPKADLPIDDYVISRLHAKITRQGNELTVQDLESRNGTKVNDAPVTLARLRNGDRITLGNFVLVLREQGKRVEDQEVELDERKDITDVGGTIIRSATDLESLLQPTGGRQAVAITDIERSNRILRMLTQVAKTLISADKLEDVLEKVMDLVFENISCERGVLGLYEEGDHLALKVVKYRKPRPAGDRIVIPRAITNRVRQDRVSILTMDAQHDQRFDTSQSIMALGIRSAMCVPLWEKELVIGIIYVDEDIRAGMFNANDLDLLAALGNYAAVAIERARLNQRIREEQLTRAKLERYHSPGVVEMILAGGGSLESLELQEREVSVLFTDVVGFTTMSEAMEPREVGQTINELFTELTECIFKFEGTLDKYIGDCIMAVFGAPIPQADNARICVQAALEMHHTLDKLNAEEALGAKLQLRTGINTGRVMAGDIGSPKRKDYSVLGDAVNLASRLESQVAKPGQIVIGEDTYSRVKTFFECESLGTYSLKGKKREVAAYRVLGEKRRS